MAGSEQNDPATILPFVVQGLLLWRETGGGTVCNYFERLQPFLQWLASPACDLDVDMGWAKSVLQWCKVRV